jgi:hypothetical protein
MVFAGFFISTARFVAVAAAAVEAGEAVFVTGNFDVSAATLKGSDMLFVTPSDIEFKTDGTKLFVVLLGSTTIYEYTLSTAWDLTTLSSDATATFSVSGVDEVRSIDFDRTGNRLYACGSGKAVEVILSTGYSLSSASSQSSLDISLYSGDTIHAACFSNSVSNNYLHFLSSNVSHINTISTIEIDSTLSNSTFVGRSSNVLSLIQDVVAHDLESTRTLEISGGGQRAYQIYRNSDLSNVYVVEYKFGTPHDSSTITSTTQIEDYFDLATQHGGTFTFDPTNSLKIKPDGSEMFLSGVTYFNNRISTNQTHTTIKGGSIVSRNLVYFGYPSSSGSYGRSKIFKYDANAGTFDMVYELSGPNDNYSLENECGVFSKDGTLLIMSSRKNDTVHFNSVDTTNGNITSLQYFDVGSSIEDGFINIALTNDESQVFIGAPNASNSGHANGEVQVFSNVSGTWTLTQTLKNPNTVSHNNTYFGAYLALCNDDSTLVVTAMFDNEAVTSAGAARIYTNSSGTWTHTASILGSSSNLRFGDGIPGINGDGTLIAIAERYYPSTSQTKGRVKVYKKSGSTYSLMQNIDSPTQVNGTQFGGRCLAMSSDGSRLIVFAKLSNNNGALYYYYRDTEDEFVLKQTISNPTNIDYFGLHTFITPDGQRLLAGGGSGASNSHIYTMDENTQTYSLGVPDPFLYISGELDSVYDIVSTDTNVNATGSGMFSKDLDTFKVGTASIDFDGSTSMVLSSHVPEFVNETSLTLTAWFRPDAITTTTNGRNTIFASNTYHSGVDGIGFALYTHGGKGGSVAYFELYSEYVQNSYVAYAWNTNISNTLWTSGVWRHVALVLDGNNLPKCYLDGEELSGSFTLGSTWYFNGVESSGRPQFGMAGTTTGAYYDGKLDDIKFYNKSLSQNVIKQICLQNAPPAKSQVFQLTFTEETADVIPSGVTLGGTSISDIQTSSIVHTTSNVAYFDGTQELSLSGWSAFSYDFSFSCWVYFKSQSNQFVCLLGSSTYSSSNGFRVYLYDGYLYIYFNNTSTYVKSQQHYWTDKWMHVCVTYLSPNTPLLYVNGELQTTTTNGSFNLTYNTSQTLYIGGTGNSQYYYKGLIEDIRIYDFQLSPVEVEYIYVSTHTITNQALYLSYEQSNVYDFHDGITDLAVTGTGQYNQNYGSKIGNRSGDYPRGTTGTVVPHFGAISDKSVFSVATWFFLTSTDQFNPIFVTSSFGVTNGVSLYLFVSSGNLYAKPYYSVSNNSFTNIEYLIGPVDNYTYKWNHIAAVYESDVYPPVYFNGEFLATSTTSGTFTGTFPAQQDFIIGQGENNNTTLKFDGAIDDFRVFDKRLSARDVYALYKQYTETIIYSRNITDTPSVKGIESPDMSAATTVTDYQSYGWSSGTGFEVTASGTQSGQVYSAFDKNRNSYWQMNGSNQWIRMTYPYPVAITSYSYRRGHATVYYPLRWVLQGLDEVNGFEDLELEHEIVTYQTDQDYIVSEGVNKERKKYRSYRLYIYTAQGNYNRISDISFFTDNNVQPEILMKPNAFYNSGTTTYTLSGGYTNKPAATLTIFSTEDLNSSNLVAVGVARTEYPYKFTSNNVVDSSTFEYGQLYYRLTDLDNNVITGNFEIEPILENPDFTNYSVLATNYTSSYGWPIGTGWTITESSKLNTSFYGYYAFNKATNEWIPTQNALPAHLSITYPYAVTLKGYEVQHDRTNSLMTNWVLQGLEDDGTYSNLEPIRTISSDSISSVRQLFTGDVNPDNNSYSTYRLFATSYMGSYLRIEELFFYTADTSASSLRSNIGIIPEPGTDTLYVTGGHFTKPGSSISLYTSQVKDSSNIIATLTPSSQVNGNYFPAGDSFAYSGFDMSNTVYYTANDYYNNQLNGTFVPKIIKENPDFNQYNSLTSNYYTKYRWNAGTVSNDWRINRSSVHATSYYSQYAFQKSTNQWISAQQLPGTPQWISIVYPYPVKVNHYMIEHASTNGRLTDWVLQGSNDHATWIDVEPTRTNNAPLDTVIVSDGVNPDSNSYYSYRLYITASNSGSWARIREIRMYTTEDPPYLMGEPGFVPDASGNVRVRCGFSSKPAQLYIYSDSEKYNLLVTLTSELFRPFHFTTAQQYADSSYTKGTTVYYTLTDYDDQSTTGTINTQPIKESPDFTAYNAIGGTGTTYWTNTSDWRAYTNSRQGTNHPRNAFDKSTTSWVSPSAAGTTTPVWLDMIYPFAVKLKYAQFRFNGLDDNQNSPTYFKIQGSNDRANWSNVITVDYRTNGKPTHYETEPIYQNINPDSNAFSIYRMYVEDWNNRGGSYFYVQDAVYYTIDDIAPQLLIEPGFVLMTGSAMKAIRPRTNKPGTFYYYSDSARTTLLKTAGTVSAHPYEDTSTSGWTDANFTYDSTIYLRFIDTDNNILDQDITPRVIRKNPTFTSTVVTNTNSYTYWPSNQSYDFASFGSSQYDSTNYPYWKSFDNGNGQWLSQTNVSGPHWVGIRYPYVVKGYKYALRFPADNSENCRLINFIMQGSNDGVNWSNLQNSTNTFEAPPPYLDNFVFDIDDTSNTYQSFRLFIEDFGGSSYIQLEELRIYTEDLPPTFQREPGFFLRSDGSTVNVNGGYVTKPCTLYVYSDSARTSLVFSVSTASATYTEHYRLNHTTFTDSNYSHDTLYYYTLEDSVSAPLKTEGTFTSTDVRESPKFTTTGALSDYVSYGWDDYSTGWVIRSSGHWQNNSSYHRGRAFDKNRASTYLSSNATNPWLEIEYPVSQYLRGFLLDIGAASFMSEYKIQGSNDGSTYTDIESFSRILSPSSANGYYFWEFKDVDSSTAYTHFRMQATTVNNTNYAYVYEWKLFTSSSAPSLINVSFDYNIGGATLTYNNPNDVYVYLYDDDTNTLYPDPLISWGQSSGDNTWKSYSNSSVSFTGSNCRLVFKLVDGPHVHDTGLANVTIGNTTFNFGNNDEQNFLWQNFDSSTLDVSSAVNANTTNSLGSRNTATSNGSAILIQARSDNSHFLYYEGSTTSSGTSAGTAWIITPAVSV